MCFAWEKGNPSRRYTSDTEIILVLRIMQLRKHFGLKKMFIYDLISKIPKALRISWNFLKKLLLSPLPK